MYIITNHASRYYVGITKLQPLDRLKRHNNGDVYSTRWGRPWALVHSESFRNYAEARAREKQIKSWHGGNAFKKLLTSAAGSSKGRTWDFGSQYEGSIPSPAALAKTKH